MFKSLRSMATLPVLLALVLTGCGGGESGGGTPEAKSPSPVAGSPGTSPATTAPSPVASPASTENKPAKNEYPEQVVKNFMGSCDPKGEQTEFCKCSLEKIQAKYTIEEFTKIDKEIAAGKPLPDDVKTLTQECLTEVGGPEAKGQGYPKQVVDNFMKGCDPDGKNTAMCKCSIDKLQAKYTLAQFAKIEEEYTKTNKLPDEFTKIVEECAKG